MHSHKFPNETEEYRAKRNELLAEEVKLRKQIEAVAEMRRKLPSLKIVNDYVFKEIVQGVETDVTIKELFKDKDTLIIYNFMYGPEMGEPCPYCTSILDAFEGTVEHLDQKISTAVVAKSPIDRILAFGRGRGWIKMRLVSSHENKFNEDYHGESETGSQWPMAHVFTLKNGQIFHFWSSEMLFANDEEYDARHIDLMWPLWNYLDLTPDGRGTNFYPDIEY